MPYPYPYPIWRVPVLLLVLALIAAPTSAQVPPVLTYQGVITEPDGTPVDGLVGIDLDLYADAAGGLPVWSAQLDVLVELGLFQVELGEPANPLPQASFEGPLFLEVAVGGETLSPRQRLTSVPFALQAAEAGRVGGRSASELDQAADVAALAAGLASIDTDVSFLASGLAAVEQSPVLDLEDFVSVPAAGTLSVEGEVRLGGSNIPLTVVDGFIGVNVQAALQDGVRANSVDDSGLGFGGFFTHSGPTSALGAGVYALGNQGAAPDLILAANDGSSSGDDGRISSDPFFPDSDIFLDTNDALVIQLDQDESGEDADFTVRGPGNQTLLNVDEDGTVSMKGPLDPGDGRPRAPGLLPIAVGTIDRNGKLVSGINLSQVSRDSAGNYFFRIPGAPRPVGCGGSARYALTATAELPGLIAAASEGGGCPLSFNAGFSVRIRNSLGLGADAEFSVVVYQLPTP